MASATSAYAVFCPNSFNSINVGDSIETVMQVCGAPNNRNDFKDTPPVPQEWIYYKSMGFNQGHLKLSIVFNENNQVVNIDVSADGIINTLCQPAMQVATGSLVQMNCNLFQPQHNVSVTTLCSVPVRVGDQKNAVENACGKPSFINQTQQALAQTTDRTELRYDGTQSISLLFQNGHLVDRRVN